MEFLAAIDRFEGEVAVLAPIGEAASEPGSGARFLWPKRLLPQGAGEGAILRVTAAVDEGLTLAARDRTRNLLDALGPFSDDRKPEAGGGGPA